MYALLVEKEQKIFMESNVSLGKYWQNKDYIFSTYRSQIHVSQFFFDLKIWRHRLLTTMKVVEVNSLRIIVNQVASIKKKQAGLCISVIQHSYY